MGKVYGKTSFQKIKDSLEKVELHDNVTIFYREKIKILAPQDCINKNSESVVQYLDSIKNIENTIGGKTENLPSEFLSPYLPKNWEQNNIEYFSDTKIPKSEKYIFIETKKQEIDLSEGKIKIVVEIC